MKNKRFTFILILAGILLSGSCTKDNKTPRVSEFKLLTSLPEGLNHPVISNLTANFKNMNTGKVTAGTSPANDLFTIELAEGMYHIDIEGDIQYTADEKTVNTKIRGYQESVNIAGETSSETIRLFLSRETSDFVIAEIFYTGTVTPEGKQYNGDKYFRIYNNSDTLLYADGLSILESAFMTVEKQTYTPDIMNQALAVNSIITIPGTGKEYPVNPGEYIIIGDNAIDHRVANSQSFDLSKANFEIYHDDGDDIDNPEIPNLSGTYGKFVFHNRGFRGYAIARLGDINAYLNDYTYDYEWEFVFGEDKLPVEEGCYKVPNEWIIDAVNLSIESDFQWIVTAPSVDMGWTYCGSIDGDFNRYGKSVRRKVLSTTPDGRQTLKDTNNSTLDFDAEATPSLKK